MDAQLPPVLSDLRELAYLSVSAILGLLSAFASLIGSDKQLNARIVTAYLIAGALVSLGITMFLVSKYGFSYFLLGVSIFAGYKAFDILTLAGMAIAKLAQKIISKL